MMRPDSCLAVLSRLHCDSRGADEHRRDLRCRARRPGRRAPGRARHRRARRQRRAGRVSRPTKAGRYHLLSLRVGMYVISVELPGFRRVVRSGVLVQLGQTLTLDFTLDVGGPVEEIRVTRKRAAAADGQRRDQRRHREPAGRSAATERPQLPCARAIERRGRDTAWRHARRGLAAGGTASERRRPAIRSQHLHARRREGDRRTLQQPRHQPVGRFDPGIQDSEVAVSGGVRRQGVSVDQRRDARGSEQRCVEACSSSSGTTSSTRTTTSIRRISPCRRSARISSAAPLAGRSCGTAASSSSATRDSALAAR